MKNLKTKGIIILLLLSLCLCACQNDNSKNSNDGSLGSEQSSNGSNNVQETKKTYTPNENQVKNEAISEVRDYLVPRLKNPNSLVINGATIRSTSETDYVFEYYVLVDYSAQNGFGGMNRDGVNVQVTMNKFTGKYSAKRY